MSDEIQVIDLAPADSQMEPAPCESPPPPPPLVRQESVLAPVPEQEEAPKPKRKGRPPGAKNKSKPKPPPLEEIGDVEEEPPTRKRVRFQHPDHPNLEMAHALLNAMHAQAESRANKKRRLYETWF